MEREVWFRDITVQAQEFGNYKEKSGQELRVLCPNLTDDSQISLLPLGFSLHFLGIVWMIKVLTLVSPLQT